MQRPILLCIVSLLAIASCEKNDPGKADTGESYFPVDIGRMWVYDVDSLWYDNNTGSTTIDTFHYQYKEYIADEFTDAEGKSSRRLERYYRANETEEWSRVNAGVLLKDGMLAQKVIENTRYVKMVFPLKTRKTWNGNAYNDRGTETYEAETYDEAAGVNGMSFPKTMRVLQTEELNAIEEIRRYEIYARDVGMIYFQWDSINTQNKKPPAVGTVSRGFRLRYMIKSFQP